MIPPQGHNTPGGLIREQSSPSRTSNAFGDGQSAMGIPANPALTQRTQAPASTYQHQSSASSAYHLAGERLYQAGKLNEALSVCQTALGLDPGDAESLLLASACLFDLGRYVEAETVARRLLDLRPNFAEAYGNLGHIRVAQNDFQQALSLFERALEIGSRSAQAYMNRAAVLVKLNRFEESIRDYEMAITIEPNLPDAYNNLGNIKKLLGKLQEAKSLYQMAVRLKPDHVIAWTNLANRLMEEGDRAGALGCLEQTVRYSPYNFEYNMNLARAYRDARQYDKSIRTLSRMMQLFPNTAQPHAYLGGIYYELRDLTNAVMHYRQALALDPHPKHVDVCNNLGNALRELGKPEEAIFHYQQGLKLDPKHPHLHNNLGNALKDKGLVPEAERHYRLALQENPNFPAALNNLASLYKDEAQLDEALKLFYQAIVLDPNFADAHSNLGNVLKELGRINEAIQHYMIAVTLNPRFADAYSNLAAAYKDSGDHFNAIEYYQRALRLKPEFPDALCNLYNCFQITCNWGQLEILRPAVMKTLDRQLAMRQSPSVQPFHALYYPLSLEQSLAISRAYAERVLVAARRAGAPRFSFENRKLAQHPQGRLRVGYVSSDFGDHPMSHLMQSVFGFHDRERFEVFCYALSRDDGSSFRNNIAQAADHFIELAQPMTFLEAACRIHADGINVLVNLNGYTKGARNEIFALHPAPVQISYLGFAASTGAPYIEYLVTDKICSPPEFAHCYSEHLIYMPHSYFANDHMQSYPNIVEDAIEAYRRGESPDLEIKRKYGVPEDAFVFCNYNQLYKMDPQTFGCWMRVLKRVPNSVLVLLKFPPIAEANVRKEVTRHCVDSQRVIFLDVAPKEEHIRRGMIAHLFLDTPACNGHTTGTDALWGGLPFVTLPGQKMATRVAASLAIAVGCPEMVTSSLEEYEERCVRLGTDRDAYRTLRKRLIMNRRTHPLFNTRLWVQHFERALLHTQVIFEEGRKPSAFEVPAEHTNPITELALEPGKPVFAPVAGPVSTQQEDRNTQVSGVAQQLGAVQQTRATHQTRQQTQHGTDQQQGLWMGGIGLADMDDARHQTGTGSVFGERSPAGSGGGGTAPRQPSSATPIANPRYRAIVSVSDMRSLVSAAPADLQARAEDLRSGLGRNMHLANLPSDDVTETENDGTQPATSGSASPFEPDEEEMPPPS